MATLTNSKRLSSDETLDLWRSTSAPATRALRDRLVLTFAPMVKYIVYRKVREIPARCEVDDFISCGLEALIRSIDRYDPEKGATLEQFAWTRIHGAVLDELRRNDWAPRSLRRWDRDLTKARDQFVRPVRPPPHPRGARRAMGVTPAELLRRQDEIARAQVGSLNTVVPPTTTPRSSGSTRSRRRPRLRPRGLGDAPSRPRSGSATPSSEPARRASARSRSCSTSTT